MQLRILIFKAIIHCCHFWIDSLSFVRDKNIVLWCYGKMRTSVTELEENYQSKVKEAKELASTNSVNVCKTLTSWPRTLRAPDSLSTKSESPQTKDNKPEMVLEESVQWKSAESWQK